MSAVDVFAIATGNEDLRWLTKPFIVPLLIQYLVVCARRTKSKMHKPVIAALFFSWSGDVLLMLEPQNSNFFILGLVSFLAAHIFYIIFFHRVKEKEIISTKLLLIVTVIIYYIWLIVLLYSHLGSFKIPVIVYGSAISVMLAFALHLAVLKDKKGGIYMAAGATLFVLSDSVLAMNRFYSPFEYAGIVTMLTYIFAQLLIVRGTIKYISKTMPR
jgi:uncharacterized membrane protein YhhN